MRSGNGILRGIWGFELEGVVFDGFDFECSLELRDFLVLVFEGKVFLTEIVNCRFEFLRKFFDVDGEESLSLSFECIELIEYFGVLLIQRLDLSIFWGDLLILGVDEFLWMYEFKIELLFECVL